MNKKSFLIVIFLVSISSFSQSVLGKWKTVDDESGKEKAIIEIYQKGNKVYGKVIEILEVEHKDKKCTLCSDTDKDKPILGLNIIKGLTKDGDEYGDGKIVDPKNGKKYQCYIKLIATNKLKVRGFIGFSLLGRTQYWYRQN